MGVAYELGMSIREEKVVTVDVEAIAEVEAESEANVQALIGWYIPA